MDAICVTALDILENTKKTLSNNLVVAVSVSNIGLVLNSQSTHIDGGQDVFCRSVVGTAHDDMKVVGNIFNVEGPVDGGVMMHDGGEHGTGICGDWIS
jgi:hypothetical protein